MVLSARHGWQEYTQAHRREIDIGMAVYEAQLLWARFEKMLEDERKKRKEEKKKEEEKKSREQN